MSNLLNITKTKLKRFKKIHQPIYLIGLYIINPCFGIKTETIQSLLLPIIGDESSVNVNWQSLDISDFLK